MAARPFAQMACPDLADQREARHALGRAVFFHRLGELGDRSYEGDENEKCRRMVSLPGWVRRWYESVAIFRLESVGGEWTLTVRGLCGQGGEVFGRSEALVPSLDHQQPVLKHVHEFLAG